MSLIDKLRRAREERLTVGEVTLIYRRPTALEMIELQAKPKGRAVLPFLCGWEGVRELDLIPGGSPEPLEFDSALAVEWLTDRMDLLVPLVDAVFDAYTRHAQRQEASRKN